MWWGREGLLPVEFPWVEGSGAGRGREGGWPSRQAGTGAPVPFPARPVFLAKWICQVEEMYFLNLKSYFCFLVRNNHPECPIWIFEFLKIWWKWVFFTAAACRVLFTLRKEVSASARLDSRLGPTLAAASCDARPRRPPPATLPFCPHILDKSQ